MRDVICTWHFSLDFLRENVGDGEVVRGNGYSGTLNIQRQ